MQIFFLSDKWILILSILLWLVFQTSAGLICRIIPARYYSLDSVLFKERAWEKNGKFYSKFFKVKKWKHLLPDGAAATRGYRKKNLKDYSSENLEHFLVESCRAELTHILAILPFWVFGLFGPPKIIPIMLFYALAVNMPCIIVQRYNRPRIKRLIKRSKQ